MAERYGKDWNPAAYYKNEDIAGNYDRERFTSLAGRVFNALEKRLVRKAFAGIAAGARVGDVPCGTGRLAEVLLEQGFEVTGVDISAQMLATARARLAAFGDRFHTQVADAKALAQAGIGFDAVLCARVLMHFPLDEQIEFLRGVVAATKGRVVITQGIDTPYQRLRRGIKRLLRNQNPASFPLRPRDVDRLLRETGLKEIRRYYVLPIVSEAFILVAERA